MTRRIGFCCKYIDRKDQVNGIKATDTCKKYNTGTTTIAWLNRQTTSVADDKMWSLVKSNIASIKNLVHKVSEYPDELKMVRLSSDLLPAYTELKWGQFYHNPLVEQYISQQLASVGQFARDNNVRLSMHPSQFCVLASADDDIVQRSIADFEYHADIARWMGYGKEFQDFKINVHISGKRGPQGIINALSYLSPEARNCLSIENEENSWGLDDTIELADHCALVLDIHHHLIHSGEYIQAADDRIKRVIDSWRGKRPVIHYSVSREDLLKDFDNQVLLEMDQMLASGLNKQKLRAHSDFMWNRAVNEWAYTHWAWADVQVEAKGKNIASYELYLQWNEIEQQAAL